MNYSNHPVTKEFRRELRHDATPAERKMWKYLRGKQIDGWRFRQQHGFGAYVLDFYCPALRLCIETDGNVHDLPEVRQKDVERTKFLNENRTHVLRISNEDVEEHIETAINAIKEYIDKIRT